MTDLEIEKDADECWALWRRMAAVNKIDIASFSEIEVWHHAYRAGIELGKEIERTELEDIFQDYADNEADESYSDAFQVAAFLIAERLIKA